MLSISFSEVSHLEKSNFRVRSDSFQKRKRRNSIIFGQEKTISQIAVDLPRTFPGHTVWCL